MESGQGAFADRYISIFPTTLLHRRLADMADINAQLAALIAQIETAEPNSCAGTTTEGGFQTRMDIFQRDNPALHALKQHLLTAVQHYAAIFVRQECVEPPARMEFHLWGWGISLRAGNWQGLHVHPDAHISGVYYVAVPLAIQDPCRDDGKISFYDPRPRASMNQLPLQGIRRRETPAAGDLFVFPSWLEHSVSPFQGPGERICIAFNARLFLA